MKLLQSVTVYLGHKCRHALEKQKKLFYWINQGENRTSSRWRKTAFIKNSNDPKLLRERVQKPELRLLLRERGNTGGTGGKKTLVSQNPEKHKPLCR